MVLVLDSLGLVQSGFAVHRPIDRQPLYVSRPFSFFLADLIRSPLCLKSKHTRRPRAASPERQREADANPTGEESLRRNKSQRVKREYDEMFVVAKADAPRIKKLIP